MGEDEHREVSSDRLRDAFSTDDELVAVSARLLRMVRGQLRTADDQLRETDMLAGSAWRALVAARRSLDQASPGDSLDEAQRHLSEAIRALDRTKFRLLVHARQMVTDAQRALDDPAGWAVPTLEELADHFANRPMEAEDADEG